MVRSAKSKKRKSGVSVDFTGVEADARSIPDGTYKAAVVSIEENESDNGPYLSWKWKAEMKKGSATVFDNTSLQPQSLWRLRLLLEAIGEEIVDGVMDLDLDDYVGREAQIEITNEKYEGKDRARITGFISLENVEESDEEEDEEAEEEEEAPKKSSKKKAAKPADDEEEDEDEEEEEAPKSKKSPAKSKKSSAKEPDEEEDEDEEEEEAPKSKSKSKLKVGSKVSFKDEAGKRVKGVIVRLEDDVAAVEDSSDEEWEVETSELTLIP